MELDNLTIPMWCEHWARWAVKNAAGVKGYPSVSLIADRFQFQEAGAQHITPLGEKVFTAKGRQTRSHRAQDIPDDAFAEVLDAGISQMGQYRPDLQIVVGAEYLGVFPEFLTEAWKPGDAEVKHFKRLQACMRDGRGFHINAVRRKPGETVDAWRGRLSDKLRIGKRQFYTLLDGAHLYLMAWRDTELRRMVEDAQKISA